MKVGKRRSLSVAVLIVLLIGLGAALATPGQASDTMSNTALAIDSGNYQIGPGDVIDVIVSKNDTLSRAGLRVSNSGTIQLAMLDHDVAAACRTERELADEIKEQYKKYLVDPYVNVSVREFNSKPVAVIGAVNSPGRFQLQRPVRLVEMLTFVNGTSANAGTTAEIIRDAGRPRCEERRLFIPPSSGEELLSVNLGEAFKNGESSNPVLVAGDIVRVAAADQEMAYIQGNIRAARSIDLSKDPVTLTQAIAMAGGTTDGAQLERIVIRRQIAGTVNREQMVVNVKAINQQKRDDVLIRVNDIIEVPGPSGGKKLFQDLYRSIVPMVTRLPVTVIP